MPHEIKKPFGVMKRAFLTAFEIGGMKMNNKVRQVLNTIVEKFKTGEIPDAVALVSFPMADIPSGKWSFMNRIIMLLSGTADARGWRQWKGVNRCVKKGGKAIYIH